MKRIKALLFAAAMAAMCSGCQKESAGEAETAAASLAEAETTAASLTETESQETAASSQKAVASGKETVSQIDVTEAGMMPVYAEELLDGSYPVQAESSSSMFKIESCLLTVRNGKMEAAMTMGGTGYLKLFMGTGEEALSASEEQFIPYEETADGHHVFVVPVSALDQGIPCAAFSKNKEKWYDRTILFRASSLPPSAFAAQKAKTAKELGIGDGSYTAQVTLGGGSGRASVESPAKIRITDGEITARIVWGSSNYDYMKVDGVRYDRLADMEKSAFEIPVAGFDWALPVIADTTAMSTPHEIEYTLTFDSATLMPDPAEADAGFVPVSRMELRYASQFSVEYDKAGRALLTIGDDGRFFLIPEGKAVPKGLPEHTVVLRQPVKHTYLVATSAMDFFCSLDALDAIALSGTEASGWYLEKAREAMETQAIRYAGKYSAPDYERILAASCDLAVESTMILHAPEVKEKLEQMGVPVLVERSSYESHPLGRMEWIKVYGLLTGKEALAKEIFDREAALAEEIAEKEPTGKSAAFFYVNSNGAVNVRKSGDYVAKMIGMAGGRYVPDALSEEGNALSTMNIQMEAFYEAARDADILIYNSAVDGELETISQLIAKSSLFSDFQAVKSGNVWCTGKNMFQETMGAGEMIRDFHRILEEEEPEGLTYLHRLK